MSNGGKLCAGLQYKYQQRLFWLSRQPLDFEAGGYGQLDNHEELKNLGNSHFIRFMEDAENCHIIRLQAGWNNDDLLTILRCDCPIPPSTR